MHAKSGKLDANYLAKIRIGNQYFQKNNFFLKNSFCRSTHKSKQGSSACLEPWSSFVGKTLPKASWQCSVQLRRGHLNLLLNVGTWKMKHQVHSVLPKVTDFSQCPWFLCIKTLGNLNCPVFYPKISSKHCLLFMLTHNHQNFLVVE